VTPGGSGDKRHRAREAALQLMYQWEIGRVAEMDLSEAADSFWGVHPAPVRRRVFATELAKGAAAHLSTIDPLIEAHSDNWRLSRMAVIDRIIMRLAIYELMHTDTPPPVVIDEALELAKTFSGEQAVGFINGLLDSVRRHLEADDGDARSL
jgi:N utilization substance protein B